jgi:hypothetical protein
MNELWFCLIILAVIVLIGLNSWIEEEKRRWYALAKKKNKPVTFESRSVIDRRR